MIFEDLYTIATYSRTAPESWIYYKSYLVKSIPNFLVKKLYAGTKKEIETDKLVAHYNTLRCQKNLFCRSEATTHTL